MPQRHDINLVLIFFVQFDEMEVDLSGDESLSEGIDGVFFWFGKFTWNDESVHVMTILHLILNHIIQLLELLQ